MTYHLLYWLGTGRWSLGLVHAQLLHVSKTCPLRLPWSEGSTAHPTAHPWLLMAWAIFWFLILYGPLPLRAGLCLIVGFSSFSLLFCSFLQSCYHFLPYHSAIPVVTLFDPSLLLILLLMTQCAHLGFVLHYLWALLSHLFPFGHPWPICFPWASLALFLTLHSYGLLLTPLRFLSPITLSFILRAHGFAINPLLSLLALLRACCGPFSLFYITYCPWVYYFSLSELL